jgi:hypothetical protein
MLFSIHVGPALPAACLVFMLSAPVSAAQAYAVLTDYDRMKQFLADLDASRIFARTNDSLPVWQAGKVRFGWLAVPFEYRSACSAGSRQHAFGNAPSQGLNGFDAIRIGGSTPSCCVVRRLAASPVHAQHHVSGIRNYKTCKWGHSLISLSS